MILEYLDFFPSLNLTFKEFNTISEVEAYVEDESYGLTTDLPTLCFGFFYEQLDDENFNYTLHYFDSKLPEAVEDIPTTQLASLDYFQNGPDMDSYKLWLSSGYLLMMKIINDVILQLNTKNKEASINYVVMAQKFSPFKTDQFGPFIGIALPFFIIIAYVCPLCILIFRMVKEKETKVKEGMKIMGLKEYVYFLSFFIQWFILNTIYSVINSLILNQVLQNTSYITIFAFFWLFGMSVFSMAYFFQSFMEKTRIAVVIGILVYFIMFFVSQTVLSIDVKKIYKLLISLLPPTALQLGLSVFSKFEANFIKFGLDQLSYSYDNYSVGDMYIMLTVDIFFYLILGFLLENILPQTYGVGAWCRKNSKTTVGNKKEMKGFLKKIKASKKNIENSINSNKENYVESPQIQGNNFQSEQNYQENLENGECLQIRDLKKVFDDGKVAVDGLSLNLYNQEIFALLGHNGAGKSTTISILCGLYEATSGTAYYKNSDILDPSNMKTFRKKLGICPQQDVLFDNLTVREHLNMFCVFKGVEKAKIEQEVEKALVEMQLQDISNQLAKGLSGGNKRKVSIAIALIGGSEVVFLDEPSSGMDITSRRNLWEILKKCVEKRIIVLTTHYMEEAAILGNRIGIVSNGKLKCCGSGLFLIDRLGKYISLDIYPKSTGKNEEILKFVSERLPGVVCDALPEKILFRLPKINIGENSDSSYDLKRFFDELDSNVDELQIKSYAVSMPTLEDVFLNISAENNHSLTKENRRKDIFANQKIENYSWLSKFVIDFKSSLKKRFLQIIRDKKTFLIEIICPIILVLIGLGVSSVQFVKNSPSIMADLNQLPAGQQMIINSNLFTNDTEFNSEFIYYPLESPLDEYYINVLDYNNLIERVNISDSYGSYYIFNTNSINQNYEFAIFSNLVSRNAPVIYTQYMLNKIHSLAVGKTIKVNNYISPFPLTTKVKSQGKTRNDTNLVFFFSIAFALIPANFITFIIRERETNTKHLQVISGISLISYWMSNFIFELVKYYFIGGVNLLLILWFGVFPPYLWLLYLLYGFPMIAFTYLLSFFFKTESSAQNVVIFVNFLFGSLAGTIVIVLRVIEDVIYLGKIIAYILRIVPSFCFAYGFNQILSKQLLYFVDYKNVAPFFPEDSYIISLEYAGVDALFLGVEFFVYLLLLIMFEVFRNGCRTNKSSIKKPKFNTASKSNSSNSYVENLLSKNKMNDTLVVQEIEKANFDENNDKYSIKVKNLEKVYKNGLCDGNRKKAVNNLSFCLEAGECFGLLGVNGAGKTTTFKALTCDDLPTNGEIFINGIELTQNFDKVRNLIGYCPQFDAIFDYMTVLENLEFYANIKGLKQDIIQESIDVMLTEMNLSQYKNKISGNLSGGNKRKLSVAIAMIGNPPIILLDEPSTGMDPEARRFMWDVISSISTRNKSASVILTTHSMEEAENLCKRIGIMVGGQFKCIGTSQSIKDKYGYGYEIDIRIELVSEEVLKDYKLTELNLNDRLLNLDQIKNTLILINKEKYFTLIENSKLGLEILEEVSIL